jgi:hypothetical protein
MVICCQGRCAIAANDTRRKRANLRRVLFVFFI